MSQTFLNSILWPEGCKSNSKITNLRVQLQPSEEIIVITYQNPKTVEWITTKWFTTSQNRFRKLVVAVAAEVPEPEAVEEDKEEDDPGNQDHSLPCLTWQDVNIVSTWEIRRVPWGKLPLTNNSHHVHLFNEFGKQRPQYLLLLGHHRQHQEVSFAFLLNLLSWCYKNGNSD